MLSAARGYDPNYLLKEVATGRENYYTGAVAEGEPPGVWWGAGAATLGLEGEVAAQDMNAVYKHRLDPRAEGFSDPDRWGSVQTLGHGGRAYKSAETLYTEALAREPTADAARRDELRVEASKGERQNLAFLDLTFSVPKSITLLHSSFEAEEVKARNAGLEDEAAEWGRLRERVEEAIWAGNRAAMSYLEAEAGYARVGHHGGAGGRWIDAHSWIGTSFFQHDSREHDPQLHIHNPVANVQLCADGKWRTLDSRAIYAMKPAAAAVGERTTTEDLVAGLGVGVAMRPDGKAREVTCVQPELRDEFSTRSHHISPRAAQLKDRFVERYGREPNAIELDGLKREASLSTRPAKSHGGETHEQMVARVRERAAGIVEGGLAGIAHTARAASEADPAERPAVGRFDPEMVIADAIEALTAKKAVFSHAEAVAEVDRQLPDVLGLPDGTDVRDLLHGLADQVMDRVEDVDTPLPGDEVLPDELRLNNGRSAYDAPGRHRGVSREALHSENRLRAATADCTGVRLASSQVTAFLAELRAEGIELGPDQEAALTGVLTSGARVETLIGPAGTGKSFTIGAIARAWTDPNNRPHGEPERRVFGLATAQVAADVLAAEGLTSANVAAWLAAQHRLATSDTAGAGAGRSAVEGDEAWRVHRGDIVVVDESAMADREQLAAIHGYVERAGADMLLVGDPAQLFAVGAGGVMDLVANAGARYELADARRFTHEWERDASLRLRAGDASVVQEYHRQGRLLDAGTQAEAEASASRAWLADTLSGHRSLLIVDSNDTAARVSEGLREDLVRLGHVAEYGVPLRDRTVAGVGDVVQGRRIAHDVAGYAGNTRPAINREHYRVTAIRSDGALEVEVLPRGTALFTTADAAVEGPGEAAGPCERMVLPPTYVAQDLTLAYAVTTHAVQGGTVWSSHPVIGPTTDLNAAYTGMSRGTHANTAHIVTVTGPKDAAHGDSESYSVRLDPRARFETIIDNSDSAAEAHQSAIAASEQAAAWAGSPRTASERFADAAHLAATERTGRYLDALTVEGLLGPNDRARIAAEDGTAALTRLLRQAELAGHDPRQVLHDAVADRDVDGARRVSDVVIARIQAAGPFEPIVRSWVEKVPFDIAPDYAKYLDALAGATDTHAADLGRQAATDPPPWALDVLGPVPDTADDDGQARAQWEQSVGAIAVHRQIHGHTDQERTSDVQDSRSAAGRLDGHASAPSPRLVVHAADVLGSAPARGQVETYAAYRTAHRSTGLPDHTRDDLELSSGALRALVRTWENDKLWNSPAYVDPALAGTRQAEAHNRQEAALRDAEAAAARNAGHTDEHERLTREANYSRSLADLLVGEAGRLEQASQRRGEWLADNAPECARAENAKLVLHDRGDTAEPDSGTTAEELLAADRAARREDDDYREISDSDLAEPDHHPDREHHTTGDRSERRDRDTGRDDAARDTECSEMTDGDSADGVRADPPRSDGLDGDSGTVDEDTVHVPDRAEVAQIERRAREADIALRDRQSLHAEHDEQERTEQLARWHNDDVAPDHADESPDSLEDSHVDGDGGE